MAPDYVLVTRDRQAELVEAMKKQLKEFHPQGAFKSDSYGRIITAGHFERIRGLLSRTQGNIVYGGKFDAKTLKIEPTLVTDVQSTDSLMEEYVF